MGAKITISKQVPNFPVSFSIHPAFLSDFFHLQMTVSMATAQPLLQVYAGG